MKFDPDRMLVALCGISLSGLKQLPESERKDRARSIIEKIDSSDVILRKPLKAKVARAAGLA